MNTLDNILLQHELNDTYTFTLNPILIDFINYFMTVGRPPHV